MKTDSRRYFDALTTDGVERAEPNGPPTAFRIWKAGANVTDHGPTVFSDRSASLLLAEQARRGNRFSIDVDHMSLDKQAPLENHEAVGWFSLAVRDGELWATDIEWVNAAIRAGLVRGAWKYMSPAYDVNDDGEVVSFLNLSLTANPATHATTALAMRETTKRSPRMAAKASGMTWGDIKAALDGDDENKKAAAYAAIQAAFPDKEPDGDEEKKESSEDEPEKKDMKKCEGEEPEKKDSEEEPEKKDSSIAATASADVIAAQDARIRKLEADNAKFLKEREDSERKQIMAGREMSAELAKALASKPLTTVREICAALPAKTNKTATTEHVQATRGGGADGAPRLPPEESRRLKERMGLSVRADSIRWEGNSRVFPAHISQEKK